MDSLFDADHTARDTEAELHRPESAAPLAARMRPTTVDDVVGQRHLLAEGSALRTAIGSGHPHSMVLYGPPGTGKTTLARIVAHHAAAAFEELSAVEAGRAEVRAVIERARARRSATNQPTVFFLDEIHRFNKAQQDALLPAVEEGLVCLIGATTENPYFEVNSALLSRAQVYELEPLAAADLRTLLERATELVDPALPEPVLEFLAERAAGDARTALGALELAAQVTVAAGRGEITLEDAQDALQRRAIRFDKGGDQHYDYISAWIKSTRGSDPDASLYYLAAMLEGGEDARYIARRMVILASEDIGLADPTALQTAVATAHAVEHVGLPECTYALAQCAIALALAPKSNSAGTALGAARAHIRQHGAGAPPAALRSASYAGAKQLGRGIGYRYPHDEPGHVNDQAHLPEGAELLRFYEPADTEPEWAERLRRAREARGLE